MVFYGIPLPELMAKLLYGSSHLPETTKATPLLTYQEKTSSQCFILSHLPPTLATVGDEKSTMVNIDQRL